MPKIIRIREREFNTLKEYLPIIINSAQTNIKSFYRDDKQLVFSWDADCKGFKELPIECGFHRSKLKNMEVLFAICADFLNNTEIDLHHSGDGTMRSGWELQSGFSALDDDTPQKNYVSFKLKKARMYYGK